MLKVIRRNGMHLLNPSSFAASFNCWFCLYRLTLPMSNARQSMINENGIERNEIDGLVVLGDGLVSSVEQDSTS